MKLTPEQWLSSSERSERDFPWLRDMSAVFILDETVTSASPTTSLTEHEPAGRRSTHSCKSGSSTSFSSADCSNASVRYRLTLPDIYYTPTWWTVKPSRASLEAARTASTTDSSVKSADVSPSISRLSTTESLPTLAQRQHQQPPQKSQRCSTMENTGDVASCGMENQGEEESYLSLSPSTPRLLKRCYPFRVSAAELEKRVGETDAKSPPAIFSLSQE